MTWLSKRLAWVLMLASASLFFLPLGTHALWNSDEGRYAEIAREMLELKDWISPHLNYVLYFEKPPLMYWLTAASFAVFGQNEFAARFWSALFGLLTVGVTYLLGKRWKDDQTGLFAGSILATSFLFFALTQYLVLDMALTFWMTLALYASARILGERAPEHVRRPTYILALAMAGGVLTKGLIGMVFPVMVLGLTIAYARLWGQARKIPWYGAFIVTAILCAPWFVLITLQHPSFLYYFFVREHFARFLTNLHHREAPFYIFVPVILGGFLPWSVFLPKIFVSAFEHHGVAMKRDPVRALLVIWSLFVFVFFSCSQSKLVAYMLPILPALALLCGNAFGETLEVPTIPKWVNRGLISLILLFVAALGALKFPTVVALYQGPAALVVRAHGDALSFILGLVVFLLVGVWGMRHSLSAFGGIMLSQVLLLSVLSSISVGLDPYLSNKGIARIISQRAKPEERVVSYGVSYENVLQTLPFYTKRRIAVFGDPGELDMGAGDAPEAVDWFSGETTAKDAVVKLSPGTWVVTNEEYLKGLSEIGFDDAFEPMGREWRLLLLRKAQ
jgi:4-amino-4-deoxy-L-arabinose transferase-like glycosyltransferase